MSLAVEAPTTSTILALSRCIFFFDLGLSGYFFLFNLFLLSRGYSEQQMGVLTSALALGNLAGAFPASKLIQRVGLRTALLICLSCTPVIFCARALLLAYAPQIAISVISGVALSLWAVCVSPAVAATTDEQERPLAFSILFSIGIGVAALGAFAASRLPSYFEELSLHLHHLPSSDQLALISSCCLAVFGVIPAMALSASSHQSTLGRSRPLFSRSLLRFLPAVGLWGIVTGSFSPFANVFFAAHLHMHLQQIGTIFSLSQLAQVCAMLAAPFVFRRCGVTAGIVLAESATAVCFFLLAASRHPALASSLYVMLTAFQCMNEPGIYSLLMSIVPEKHRAGASASMSFTLSSSQLLAAVFAGWAFKNFGYPPALCAIAVIAILAAGAFLSIPDSAATTEESSFSEGSAD